MPHNNRTTLNRWVSIILNALVASMIVMYLASLKSIQKIYTEFGSFLQTHEILYFLFSFLAGVGIKLFLDRMYVTHSSRLITLKLKYPSLILAIIFSIACICFYGFLNRHIVLEPFIVSLSQLSICFLSFSICSIYLKGFAKVSVGLIAYSLTIAFLQSNLSSDLMIPIVLLSLNVTSIVLIWFYAIYCDVPANSRTATLRFRSKPKTIDEFRDWFKDDSIIENIEQLEPDLKVYTYRLSNKLLNRKKAAEDKSNLPQHIALCGPFGCGKSSVVKCIAKNVLGDESVGKWIHSDISTWGAENAAHMILNNVVDDINEHLEMCSFRALPQHYLAAMKEGGGTFKIITAFLSKHIDIEKEFLRLNDFLEANNYQLLITLQDVDRGEHSSNEVRLNQVASLLDRLKDKSLKNINFLVAIRNDSAQYSDVISKVSDHVENIGSQDVSEKVRIWTEACIKYIFAANFRYIPSFKLETHESFISKNPVKFNKEIYKLPMCVNLFVTSTRQLKRIMRRVDSCWNKSALLGEIEFETLVLLNVMREVNPALFNDFSSQYRNMVFGMSAPKQEVEGENEAKFGAQLVKLIKKHTSTEREFHSYKSLFTIAFGLREMFDESTELRVLDRDVNFRQNLGFFSSTVNYLDRVLLETVPAKQLREQTGIDYFTNANENQIGKKLCEEEKWREAFVRYGKVILKGQEKSKSKAIAFYLFENDDQQLEHFIDHKAFGEFLDTFTGSEYLEETLFTMSKANCAKGLLAKKLRNIKDDIFFRLNAKKVENSKESMSSLTNKVNKLTQSTDFEKLLKTHADNLNADAFRSVTYILSVTHPENDFESFEESAVKKMVTFLPSEAKLKTLILFEFYRYENQKEIDALSKHIFDEGLITDLDFEELKQQENSSVIIEQFKSFVTQKQNDNAYM